MAFQFAQSATVPLPGLGAGILIPTVILAIYHFRRASPAAQKSKRS